MKHIRSIWTAGDRERTSERYRIKGEDTPFLLASRGRRVDIFRRFFILLFFINARSSPSQGDSCCSARQPLDHREHDGPLSRSNKRISKRDQARSSEASPDSSFSRAFS